jgi:hypothetical protein
MKDKTAWILIISLTLLLGIFNNLRLGEDRLPWWGSPEVMEYEKP